MPEAKLHVTLLRHTLSPEEVVALGARLCYSRATIGDLEQKIAAKDQQAFVERLLNMGHESVLEHASFTFGVEGVSRVLLAQLTRHRLASFSVQSQRYVSYEKGFGYIVPPKIAALGPEAEAEFKAQMEQMHAWYTGWQEKLAGKSNVVMKLYDGLNHMMMQPEGLYGDVTKQYARPLHVADEVIADLSQWILTQSDR